VKTALWDSGYSGRSGSLLVVHNPAGIHLQKDARIIQLVFFGLDAPAEKAYSGLYQDENKSL
jgi:dUTP pyrophosphatase